MILPVACVVDHGAAATANNDQMLTNKHRDRPMSRARCDVILKGEFLDSRQTIPAGKNAVENRYSQTVRDHQVRARRLRIVDSRQICR